VAIADIVFQKFKNFYSQVESKGITMSSNSNEDSKAKFREALAKKKSEKNHLGTGKSGDSKIRSGQSGGGSPKMFRRKSGSS
jgi:hypothetical protein